MSVGVMRDLNLKIRDLCLPYTGFRGGLEHLKIEKNQFTVGTTWFLSGRTKLRSTLGSTQGFYTHSSGSKCDRGVLCRLSALLTVPTLSCRRLSVFLTDLTLSCTPSTSWTHPFFVFLCCLL